MRVQEELLHQPLSYREEEVEPPWDWAAELQQQVRENGISPISFHPVLGQDGYIRVNRSHLLACYPKGGKTELMVNILLEWESEEILYLSEEGRETWQDRLFELPDWPSRMAIHYVLGKNYFELLEMVRQWAGTVVVIDTIKLLGIEDENDAAKVQAALSPIIAICRQRKQTLVFIHHDNKHGGRAGRGVSGSHAFIGIVDIFLELDEVAGQPNQRVLSGRGKIRNIEGLCYERQADGLMQAIGTKPLETELKVSGALTMGWLTTTQIEQGCGLSNATVMRHLKDMTRKGFVEREAEGQGKTARWRKL